MMNMAIPSNYNTRPVQQSPTNHTPPKTPQGTNSQNIKNAATPKKDTKNTWLLWGSALAGTALVGAGIFLGVKSHRHAEAVKQIPQNLELIFGKSYSPEESLQAVKTYQDLLKIRDPNAFIEQAFNQVKKDFGYEDLSIKLHIVDKPVQTQEGVFEGSASVSRDVVSIYRKSNREQILNSLAHEFNHLRQFEYMSRSNLLEQSYFDRTFNCLNFDRQNQQHIKDIEEFTQELKLFYENLFRPLRRTKIKPDSTDYSKALAYAESAKEPANKDKEAYKNNWLEQEAKEVGKTMQKFIETIQNMKA